MSTLTLSRHIQSHLKGGRKLMTEALMLDIVKHVSTLVDKFDPAYIHQVAIVLFEYDEPKVLGRTEGDRIIMTVDIRTRIATTVFLRNTFQGKPKACQRMIDMEGRMIAD